MKKYSAENNSYMIPENWDDVTKIGKLIVGVEVDNEEVILFSEDPKGKIVFPLSDEKAKSFAIILKDQMGLSLMQIAAKTDVFTKETLLVFLDADDE
jgi:hypothetical protein